MNPRVVIFDIYKTLLDVGPPPADAEQQWTTLCMKMLPDDSEDMTLAEFGGRCRTVIDREHAAARARGIPFPEVFWPDVVCEVLPELRDMTPEHRDEFQIEQVRLWHTVSLAPGSAKVLKRLARAKILLGLASNCQPYTMHELQQAFAGSIAIDRFAADLRVFSFDLGFSKPDPHFFRVLVARLAARDIAPDESLVVGDREDNDIAPTKAQGFQTWLLTPDTGNGRDAGNWPQLGAALGDFQ